MNKFVLLMLIVFSVILVSMGLVSAAINISDCGQSIDSPGNYLLNQSIVSTGTCLTVVSSDVEIDCAGNTINYGTAGTASSFGISASASASQINLTIKNCIIIKPSAAGASGRGISLTRFANSTIVNNTIGTNGTSSNVGIYIITGSDGNNISRNRIVTAGSATNNHGIHLNAGTGNTNIEYNIITSGKGTATTDNYGIYATDPRATIVNNIVNTYGSGDSNYGVYSYASVGTKIINNTIYTSGTTGNNRGVTVYSSDVNIVANNTINTSGQASPGIYIYSSGSVNILNNQINSTADAIYMTSANLADFTSANITRDNTRSGRNITVYGGGALNLPCPDNTIIDNPADGALKFFGCNGVTIQNWYRPNRDTDGLLFVNSDNNIILNNTINGGLEALDMVNAAGTCDNNLIANNTLSSFGYLDGYAIHLYGDYNVITGNTISTSGITSGNNGINIQNDFNNITNNIISTGGTSGNFGINFESRAINNLIENNVITTSGTSSGNSGIYLSSTNTRNIIRNNSVTTSGTSGNLGIRLVTNSDNNLIESNSFYTQGLTSGNNGLDLSSSDNNIFRFNNVYTGYGSGTSDNDAISMVSSRNNTFESNILFANGTATSITSAAIFLQSRSANNSFVNNIILKSVGNAIELDFLTTYPEGNIFQNNSLSGVEGSDLFFKDSNINNTLLRDQSIGMYNFTNGGGILFIENTQFGKIIFNSAVNGSGNNLSNDIQFAFNYAQVNSSKKGLNSSANVSLYNLANNFLYPIIMRDGLYECNATTVPACINFTSLNAGNVSFSVSGWSSYSIANNTHFIPPTISLVSPQNGNTYGINIGLELSYLVSDIEENLDSCWWNIDSGENNPIVCGQNTTFDTTSGSHTITVYANDSYGLVSSSSASFEINIGAPSITLNSPIDNYLTSAQVTFSYKPEDTDLQACELWGNFNGEFILNQTSTPGSGITNHFYLNLSDGNYLWNIKCNDSEGHWAFNGNKTFTIDTMIPSLSISQPTGTKTSRTSIPLTFSLTEANPNLCWFNVYRGTSEEIANMSVSCSGSASFSVTVDADFVVNVFVDDLAGNQNSASTSFSVDTSTTTPPPASTPSDSSSGGGGGGIAGNVTVKGKISISGVSDVVMKPGETKTLTATVKNAGPRFLNNCKLNGGGQASGWISSKGIKGISPGESFDFVYSISVPLTVNDNSAGTIFIVCDEASNSVDFKIDIAQSPLKIQIISVEQKGTRLNFAYNIINDDVEQTVSAEYWMAGDDNVRVAEGKEEFVVGAGEILERQASLELPLNSAGGYVFNIKINSDSASAYSQESVILGTGTGLVGRFLSAEGGGIILIIVLCVGAFIAAIFIIRRIIKKPERNDKTGYIKINLNKYEKEKKIVKKKPKGPGFFTRLKNSLFSRKRASEGISKKGVVIIDSSVIEHLKKHAEGKDLKGKWIHVKHRL